MTGLAWSGFPLLSDMGLPMIALYLPIAWLALIPIVLIEAGYATARLNLPFSRALGAQATGNCFSALIGIPVTWLLLVLSQIFLDRSLLGRTATSICALKRALIATPWMTLLILITAKQFGFFSRPTLDSTNLQTKAGHLL
jgi:hypothetical protein